MKRMLPALCTLLVVCTALASQESYDQLLKHWDYDHSAPLSVKEGGVQDRGGVKIHDISYSAPVGDRGANIGPNGGTVTPYLVVPDGKGPFPSVIYGHWCQGGSDKLNRNEFLDEAVVLAKSGVISLLTDHVIARPGYVRSTDPLSPQLVDTLVQQVINMRRGIDLLSARKDIDPTRIAYAGHSCNGEVGGFLSGIEKSRLKAVVVMAGPLSDEVNLKTKAFQDYRVQAGPEKFDAFVAKYRWTDPALYVSHSDGIPKLLQFATKEDMLNPELAKQYLPFVAEPKTFKVYDAPHALNAEATKDRIGFLVQQLGIKPPDAQAVAGIPALVQPPAQK